MKLVRIDRLLVNRGIGSRTEIQRMIRQGRISVEGAVIGKRDVKLAENSVVEVDGINVEPLPVLLVWHKPTDIVSTMRDPMGRPDLASVLPPVWRDRFHPVGRLDKDTSGLLLFSLSGDVTQWLLHPRRAVEREYEATVEGTLAMEFCETMAQGVATQMGTFPAQVKEQKGSWVRLSVTEGKHRMVRRILANAGHPVITLHRISYGPIQLGELPCGAFRPVTDHEIKVLKESGAPIE